MNVLLTYLNMIQLRMASDDFKAYFTPRYLLEMLESPATCNLKHLKNKSYRVRVRGELILANPPYRNSAASVFPNSISDQSAVARVTKIP